MCVAIPGRVVWIGVASELSIPARITTGDHTHDVDLAMVPHAAIGDYVVAHSGYAIRIVDESTVAATQELLAASDRAIEH